MEYGTLYGTAGFRKQLEKILAFADGIFSMITSPYFSW
jgi:hypothetical protein